MDDVESLATRRVVINHGETKFDGSLPELRRRLGDKKLVRITTETPLNDSVSESLHLLERPSEF